MSKAKSKKRTAALANTSKPESKKGIANTFNPEHKIHLLVKENPKRKGSKEAKRFSLYKNGMTVAEAFELGMNTLNLTRDVERKCIRIGG